METRTAHLTLPTLAIGIGAVATAIENEPVTWVQRPEDEAIVLVADQAEDGEMPGLESILRNLGVAYERYSEVSREGNAYTEFFRPEPGAASFMLYSIAKGHHLVPWERIKELRDRQGSVSLRDHEFMGPPKLSVAQWVREYRGRLLDRIIENPASPEAVKAILNQVTALEERE